MKNILIIAVLSALMLTAAGCGQTAAITPLEDLPADYSLEQAKEDGCVVHENGDVTQGQEAFEAFRSAAGEGKTAGVRLAHYYTLGDS